MAATPPCAVRTFLPCTLSGSRTGGGLARLSQLRAFRSDPPEALRRLQQTYGPIARLQIPRMAVFLVSDPDAIQDALTSTGRQYAKGMPRRGQALDGVGEQPLARVLGQGLLTSSGDLHRSQRRLMQPLFHRDRIAGYATAFAQLADQAGDRWADGQTLDVHAAMTELTLEIITRTVFDVEMDTDVVATIRRAIDADLAGAGGPLAARPGRRPWPTPAARRRRRAVADLDRVVLDLIQHRRRIGTDGTDLLSLLLNARDADTGEAMPDRQVRDEALTILLAGHETTANALSWALHLLAVHPPAQERLGAEVDELLSGRLPTVGDLASLTYTTGVFKESMRLYPPAWVLARHLVTPQTVCGYDLPAGSMILLSPYVVHHDRRWWPRPDEFLPERWAEPAPDRPRYAYVPFGAGARQCIGNSFAEMEGVIVLATLARRWRMAEPPGGSHPARRAAVTLRPAAGLPLTVHRRSVTAAV